MNATLSIFQFHCIYPILWREEWIREYSDALDTWRIYDEYRIARRVLMVVCLGRGRGRPMLDWMDGENVAFGSR